jgi:hypothetical protein
MKPIRILRPRDGSAPGMPKAGRKREGRVKGTKRVMIGTEEFDSTLEGQVYLDLVQAQQRGLIEDMQRQVKIPLIGCDGPVLTPGGRPMHYVADFTFTAHGRPYVVDAKGHITDTYRMKRAVLAAQGVTIIEVTAKGRRAAPWGAWLRNLLAGEGARNA